jgi:hypothetical protein
MDKPLWEYRDMNAERKEKVTVRYTKAELAALDGEAKTLGMTRSEYIRTLMMHGKSRLYIEYLHGLVEQINTKMGELAEQKAVPESTTLTPAAAAASPDVLQRILVGLQILHSKIEKSEAKMAVTEEKIEHIEAFCDARAQGAIGHLIKDFGVDGTALQKPSAEVFSRKFKKQANATIQEQPK